MYKSEVSGIDGCCYANVVEDSIANSVRLTTLELCYPRFIHSEFMTHRMLSRNASSSRAIPVDRMLEEVKTDPAMPIHWGRNQPGMQADHEINFRDSALDAWDYGIDHAVIAASMLKDLGVHKQVTNRVLEPYQYIRVVVTATEWDNFFILRLHKDAQPEIQELARCMKEAMNKSTPTLLRTGEWHLPYINADDTGDLNKVSSARCARVSYLNHDKSNPDCLKDIELADKLLVAGHMSPFEHIATPMPEFPFGVGQRNWQRGVTHMDKMGCAWSNNLRGWIQYRSLL